MKRIIALFAALAALGIIAYVVRHADKKRNAADPLAVGAVAPDFSMPDQDGHIHKLSDENGKLVLLAFYPVDYNRENAQELRTLSLKYKDLQKLGVSVYGISVQDAQSHRGFRAKDHISIPLLADTEKSTARQYGVLLADLKSGIAGRVTFLISKDGKIAAVDQTVKQHSAAYGQYWIDWLKQHPQ